VCPAQDVLQLTPAQKQAMVAQYDSMLARLKAISAMPEAQLATAEVPSHVVAFSEIGMEARTLTSVLQHPALKKHPLNLLCRS